MGNHQHEDERYKKYYNQPPHGEVPQDPRVRAAMESGASADEDETTPDQPKAGA